MKGNEILDGVLKIVFGYYSRGQVADRDQIANDLGISVFDVIKAHKYWRELGYTKTKGRYIDLTPEGVVFCETNGIGSGR